MAKTKNEASESAASDDAVETAEANAPVGYDSNQAINACHDILAGVQAAQEKMQDSVKGRFDFQQRQRMLAAGLAAANQTVELPWEIQRKAIIGSGNAGGGGGGGEDSLRRDEIEALIEHRVQLAVGAGIAEIRGSGGDVREQVDSAVNNLGGSLEARLLSIVRENLTESLKTLEESLEDRMREIASSASAAAAERERVNQALNEQRKAAERGLAAAGGDELLDQIEDIRDVNLNVGDFDVSGIEEMGGEDDEDDLPPESLHDEDSEDMGEISAEEAGPSTELEMAQEPVVTGEEAPAEESFIEADESDEEVIEAAGGEDEIMEDEIIEDEIIDDAAFEEEIVEEEIVEEEIVQDEPDADEPMDEAAINRYLELASTLRGRQKHGAALELYNKVIEIDGNNFEAHIGLGAVYLQEPDYDKAAEEFGMAVESDSTSPAGFLGMGEVLFLKKEYPGAIKQYSQCLELDDELAQAYCNRGLSFYYQKNHKKAFLDLQKAYKLDPEIPNIKKYLQMVMKKLKKK